MDFNQQDILDTINGTDTPPVTDPITPVVPAVPAATDAPAASTEEPVKTEQPAATDPAAPVFNLDEELQKLTGGEIKSKDDLVQILGKSKGLGELEAKLKTFEDENLDLKAKVSVDPFANDMARKLNALYQANAPQNTIDAFIRINRVESIDDLSPLEAKKLELQIKEGLSAEEAEDYIKGTYKLEQDDPEDDSELVKMKHDALRLKVDSNASKEFLKTHKADVSQAPIDESAKVAEKQQEDFKAHVNTLIPIVKNLSNVFAFKDINVNGKDGEAAFKMDLDLSDESKASIEPALMDYINKNGANIPNTQEGIDHLKTVGENILVLQNWKTWLATATNSREKTVRAEYHNPSTPDRGKDNPNVGKTSQQELGEWLLENS